MIDSKGLEEIYNKLKYLKLVSNQTDFGTKLGYSKSHFSQIMNGAQPVTEKLVKKIQTVFGKDVVDVKTPTTKENNFMMPDDFDALERVMLRYKHHLETAHPMDRVYKAIATESPIMALANLLRRVDNIEDHLGLSDE